MSTPPGGVSEAVVRKLPIDMAYVEEVLIHLLRTPSPTGRTDEVVQYIGELLMDLGMELNRNNEWLITRVAVRQHTGRLTRRGRPASGV